MYTKGLFFSNIVQKSVKICVSEAEIIHPPQWPWQRAKKSIEVPRGETPLQF